MNLTRHRERGTRHPSPDACAPDGLRLLTIIGPALALTFVVTSCGAATVAPDPGGEGAADTAAVSSSEFLITAEALPKGWGDSNSQGIDYRTTVCGVDLEPEPPVRATSARWSQGPLGPFLEQHVRVYPGDVASGVIARLQEALPGCTGYEARGTSPESPTAEFVVEPLEVAGAPEESVAWRQVSQGDLEITSDLLLVRQGTTAVLLMSYAVRDTPDPAVLEGASAALPEVG